MTSSEKLMDCKTYSQKRKAEESAQLTYNLLKIIHPSKADEFINHWNIFIVDHLEGIEFNPLKR